MVRGAAAILVHNQSISQELIYITRFYVESKKGFPVSAVYFDTFPSTTATVDMVWVARKKLTFYAGHVNLCHRFALLPDVRSFLT